MQLLRIFISRSTFTLWILRVFWAGQCLGSSIFWHCKSGALLTSRFFSGFRWNAKPGPLTKNLETLCFFNHSKLLKRLKCSGQHRNRKVDSPSNQNQNEIQSVLIFLSDRFQISQTWKMEDGWRNVWSMPHDQCDTGGRDWPSWPNLMFLLQSTGRRRDYHGW